MNWNLIFVKVKSFIILLSPADILGISCRQVEKPEELKGRTCKGGTSVEPWWSHLLLTVRSSLLLKTYTHHRCVQHAAIPDNPTKMKGTSEIQLDVQVCKNGSKPSSLEISRSVHPRVRMLPAAAGPIGGGGETRKTTDPSVLQFPHSCVSKSPLGLSEHAGQSPDAVHTVTAHKAGLF